MSNWIETSKLLPKFDDLKLFVKDGLVDNSHADCFIYIKGRVEQRPFNFHHECWDDRDYDDHEYDPLEPTHWMLCYKLPEPPK